MLRQQDLLGIGLLKSLQSYRFAIIANEGELILIDDQAHYQSLSQRLSQNARQVRSVPLGLAHTALVVGGEDEAEFWRFVLQDSVYESPRLSAERGRKGNFLGVLQAYANMRQPDLAEPEVEQIVLLVGAGTQLSPFTQALRNIKCAFPLPDADRGSAGMTAGEAVIRTARLCTEELRKNGWNGLVVKWGDDVIIPSSYLDTPAWDLADADIIRFGSRQEPNEQLALNKEWLEVDTVSGVVVRDLSRQPLERLTATLNANSGDTTTTFVNLGGLAASHAFLSTAADVFGETVYDQVHSANWDPLFWQALQVDNQASWDAMIETQAAIGMTAAADFDSSFPEFLDLVHRFRHTFQRKFGRRPIVKMLDFGANPYWIDAGSHAGLLRALGAIFHDSSDGAAARALLGFPDSLAHGESYIIDSEITSKCDLQNSIIINSRVDGGSSKLKRAVVMGSNISSLRAEPGSIAIWTRAKSLTIRAPRGFAFRFDPEQDRVECNASAATLLLEGRNFDLYHDSSLQSLSGSGLTDAVGRNEISFAEAARLSSHINPIDLYRNWQFRLKDVNEASDV